LNAHLIRENVEGSLISLDHGSSSWSHARI
jgi:hypothetical protein